MRKGSGVKKVIYNLRVRTRKIIRLYLSGKIMEAYPILEQWRNKVTKVRQHRNKNKVANKVGVRRWGGVIPKGSFTAEQLLQKLLYYNFRCYLCKDLAVVIDHYKPRGFGGSNWLANLKPCCYECNSLKDVHKNELKKRLRKKGRIKALKIYRRLNV